jgi:hypothetical protein
MRNAETADADESRIGQTFGSDAAHVEPSVESLPAGEQCPITPDNARVEPAPSMPGQRPFHRLTDRPSGLQS